jgi:hypothetical protein
MFGTRIVLGATRKPLTPKRGNKNYYKGLRSGLMGRFTTKGHFIPLEYKKRDFIISTTTSLSPFVSPKVTSSSTGIFTAESFFTDTTNPLLLQCQQIFTK